MDSNLPNIEIMKTPKYKQFCRDIGETPKIHRKQWEFYVISKHILEHFNNSLIDKRGIGFAVGQEPLPSYYLKKGAYILATDLNPNDNGSIKWIKTGQHLTNYHTLSLDGLTKEIIKKRLTSDYVDMNHIDNKYLQGDFDFVWSSCAFEHLGSIEKGLEFIKNSLKSLKVGGIAVHTTELNLSSNRRNCDHSTSCIYSKYELLKLKNELELLGYHMMPINFRRDENLINNHVDVLPYCDGKGVELCEEIMKNPKGGSHLNLLLHDGKYISTSVVFAIIKAF